MKHLIRFILCNVLLVVCNACVHQYNRMTHLSDEELEWITNRYVGEVMYFQSQDGTMDTVTITNIEICNSTDSVDYQYYTTGGTGEYNATAIVEFSLRDRKNRDHFYIYKQYGDDKLRFGAMIFAKWTPASHPTDTCLQIDNIVLDDIVFFKEQFMMMVQNQEPPLIPLNDYAWSKQYGLVQYTFQDGTVFNRIDLK